MSDERDPGHSRWSRLAQDSGSVEARSGLVLTKLAELPERSLLDERALAEALRVTKRTIRRMVGRFELPPPVSFAGRSMWEAIRILKWFEDRADRLARDAERTAQRLNRIS